MHRALPLAALLLAATPAAGLIQTLVPLKDAVKTRELIFVATVAEVKPDTPAMVLTRTDNLKGEAPFEHMPVSLKGDKEAEKDKHADKLLKVVKKDLEMVVFASRKGKETTPSPSSAATGFPWRAGSRRTATRRWCAGRSCTASRTCGGRSRARPTN